MGIMSHVRVGISDFILPPPLFSLPYSILYIRVLYSYMCILLDRVSLEKYASTIQVRRLQIQRRERQSKSSFNGGRREKRGMIFFPLSEFAVMCFFSFYLTK